jgi:hypothetical protein
MVWRAFNVDVNPNNIKFPLPACARCLPFQNAKWNILKGPSDTTTKLLDAVEENLGIQTPRSIATARLMAVGAVGFHRSNQMLSAKAPWQYKTLYHYRHAANTRHNMGSSLMTLIEFAKADYRHITNERSGRTVAFLVPPNSPPRRTRAGAEAPERVIWMPLERTEYTPTRGRPANKLHKLRGAECDGRVLVAMCGPPGKEESDVRQKCHLCGMKTNHYTAARAISDLVTLRAIMKRG